MDRVRLHHLPVTKNDTDGGTIRNTIIASQHALHPLVMTNDIGIHLHRLALPRRVIHHVLQAM